MGSILDYSFFSFSCVSQTNLNSVQRIQNRAIRTIYSLPWESPTYDLFNISGIINVRDRFVQLGCRFMCRNWVVNPFISMLTNEYISIKSLFLQFKNFILYRNFK